MSAYAQDLEDFTGKSEVLKFSQKSEKAITGQYPALNVDFSSVLEKEGYVVVHSVEE